MLKNFVLYIKSFSIRGCKLMQCRPGERREQQNYSLVSFDYCCMIFGLDLHDFFISSLMRGNNSVKVWGGFSMRFTSSGNSSGAACHTDTFFALKAENREREPTTATLILISDCWYALFFLTYCKSLQINSASHQIEVGKPKIEFKRCSFKCG